MMMFQFPNRPRQRFTASELLDKRGSSALPGLCASSQFNTSQIAIEIVVAAPPASDSEPEPEPEPDPDPDPKTLVTAPRSGGPDGKGLVLV